MRFDKINAAKAVNKHGLINRLQIDEKLLNKLTPYLKEQYINKQLVQECAPVEIRKIVAESDDAYAKLLEINNNIQGEDYGTGVYYNEPEVARGKKRMDMGRAKEMTEILMDQEIQAFKNDQIKIEEIKKKLTELGKNGPKMNPLLKIEELTEVMKKQEEDQLKSQVN